MNNREILKGLQYKLEKYKIGWVSWDFISVKQADNFEPFATKLGLFYTRQSPKEIWLACIRANEYKIEQYFDNLNKQTRWNGKSLTISFKEI